MVPKPIVPALIVTLTALLFAVGCAGGDGDESGSASMSTSSVPFDRAFIDAMIPHHESAIEMARAGLRGGLTQTELIGVAQDITHAQQIEIDDMRSWREKWFGSRDVDPRGAAELGLSEEGMGMTHGAAAINGAEDVDRAFAAAMIPHHEGAIAMAELALERGEHDEIRMLAEDIIRAQEEEIAILEPHAEGHHGS